MSRRTLLFMAFALVAGGILGYLVRGTTGGPPVAPATPTPARLPEPPPPSLEGTDIPSAHEGFRSLGEALDTVPLPTLARGTGAISGHVRLKEGGPLEGVLVRAELVPPGSSTRTAGGPPEDPDLETSVIEFVRRQHLVRASRIEGRTDATGRYVLSGLTSDKYVVRGYLEGYSITTSRGGSWHVLLPGETGDFLAERMISLPVSVLLPSGEEPDAARILVSRGPRVTALDWRRERPQIPVAPGSLTLQATAGPENSLTSLAVEVELLEHCEPAPVVLRVESLPGVMGKVIPTADADQQGWQVSLVRVNEGTEPSPRRLDGEGQSTFAWRSRGWTYAFRNLRPGTYLVGVLDRGRRVRDHAVVKVTSGMVRQDLRAAGPEPERVLEVRVEAPDGSPVVRAAVRARYRAWTSNWSGATGVAQGDGTYRLAHREADSQYLRPGGKYFAEAFTRTYGTARVEYDPDRLGTVTIRYEEPAALEVLLLGYSDTPYEGSTSLVLTADGVDEGTGHIVTDYGFGGSISADGVREYAALQPGGYELAVWVSTAGQGRYRALTERFQLGRGSNRKVLSLPPLFSLTVLVEEHLAGRRFRIEARGEARGYSGYEGERAKDGKVVFAALPAADYVLTAVGGEHSRRMFLTVTGDTTVDFVAQEATALRVTIYRRSGHLAEAGLRTGDLVVGIDGEEFESENSMEAALARARSNPRAELVVLRNGSRLVIPVDLNRAESLVEAGGSLRPTLR